MYALSLDVLWPNSILCKIFIYVHTNLLASQTLDFLEKLALSFLYNIHGEYSWQILEIKVIAKNHCEKHKKSSLVFEILEHLDGQMGGVLTGGPEPPGKSHMAIGFFRNTGMDHLAGLENSTRPLIFTTASGCRASENFDISSEKYFFPIHANNFWMQGKCLVLGILRPALRSKLIQGKFISPSVKYVGDL